MKLEQILSPDDVGLTSRWRHWSADRFVFAGQKHNTERRRRRRARARTGCVVLLYTIKPRQKEWPCTQTVLPWRGETHRGTCLQRRPLNKGGHSVSGISTNKHTGTFGHGERTTTAFLLSILMSFVNFRVKMGFIPDSHGGHVNVRTTLHLFRTSSITLHPCWLNTGVISGQFPLSLYKLGHVSGVKPGFLFFIF